MILRFVPPEKWNFGEERRQIYKNLKPGRNYDNT